MISFTIKAEGLDEEVERLEALAYRVMDLTTVAPEIERIMAVDNMAARMLGVDKDDQPFADLAEETIRRRVGSGPTLAPMEQASRIMSGFETEIQYGHDEALVIGSWPSMEAFLGYHVTGTTYMPSRDPVGVRPIAWAEMIDSLDAWVDTLF